MSHGTPKATPTLDILYQDRHVMVVNKPGGMLTQAPSGIDSIEFQIKRHLREAKPGSGQKTYLGVPHRLDRPASGVMVFALDKPSARQLAGQFGDRKVKKKYWAIVQGELNSSSGTWSDFMRKIPDRAQSEIVPSDHPDAQSANLHFYRLSSSGDLHHLEIELETGRTHQIRLQASVRGLPILGDELYGSQVAFGPPSDDSRRRWVALHARSIEFEHPVTGKAMQFAAPLTEHWYQFGLAIS